MLPDATTWQALPRRIVGLMSGTSLDGIDAALIEVSGGIPPEDIRVITFRTRTFTCEERQYIAALMRADLPVIEMLPANVRMGELFAQAALDVISQGGFAPEDIDAIASHGQTVWHIPPAGGELGATLQIGEPCVIAERTGILTVADFRPRDMAAGGQGAPLVPFADFLLFRDQTRSRAIQNIGGIGNVTVLPAGCAADAIIAFDTGPGNMVIDALVRHYTRGRMNFDCDGRMAAAGRVDENWLAELLAHPYFALQPPKSTGREVFGEAYAREMRCEGERCGLTPEDIIATATALTAMSIVRAYRDFVLPTTSLDEVILGGGGSYNPVLCSMLAARLPDIPVRTHEDVGWSGEAKEAIAFALLAHAALCGVPANIPAATGALNPVILGKIIPGKIR